MRCLLTLSFLLLAAYPADAQQPATRDLFSIAGEACSGRIGNPNSTIQWATERRLQPAPREIHDVVVGRGNAGQAWIITTPSGAYAVGIRTASRSCSTWLLIGDAADAELWFAKRIEAMRRPDIEVTRRPDQPINQPNATGRMIGYNVRKPGSPGSLHFMMMTQAGSAANFKAMTAVTLVGD